MNTDKILNLHEIHLRNPRNPGMLLSGAHLNGNTIVRQKEKATALSRSGLK
jgi:hypothetical protein